MRSTTSRPCAVVVSHMCLIMPGPVISASSATEPGPTTMLGEIFQPGPSARAGAAPVPSTARAAWPLAPVGFSGVTALLRPWWELPTFHNSASTRPPLRAHARPSRSCSRGGLPSGLQLVLSGAEQAPPRRSEEQPAGSHALEAHISAHHVQTLGPATAVTGKLDRAPCSACGPKPASALVAGGIESHAPVPPVVGETGQGEGQAPAGQGPAVVVAALGIVKGVAPAAREAFSHGGGDVYGELQLAGLGAPDRKHVLEAGPRFAPVGHRVLGEPVGVRQHHVAPLAGHRVGPPVVGQVAA